MELPKGPTTALLDVDKKKVKKKKKALKHMFAHSWL